jgi:hypothetical protein
MARSQVTANNNSGAGIVVFSSLTIGAVNVTIVDSEASNNASDGVLATGIIGSVAAAVMLRNVVASNNLFGLNAGPNAILRVAHSVVTGNGTGVNSSGGTIFSYGDNDIDGNTSNNTGVLTVIPTH